MLALPLGAPRLMPSMASTLRAPVRGVSPPPSEGAMERAPLSTVAYPLAGSLDCPRLHLATQHLHSHGQ